jgi:hypothetical protein
MAPSSQNSSMHKSDKFTSVVIAILIKLLYQSVTNYVREQGQAGTGSFEMVEIISDQTKKELEQITA